MFKILATTLLTAATLLANAEAANARPSARSSDHPIAMAEGGYVLPPISFSKFCLDYPSECAGGTARVHLSAEKMATLAAVNRQVNGSIAPTPDTSRFRFWALNVSHGDCNNFAIQKRHDLIQRGWPAGALALSVVKTPWGEGHLVVTVRTDAGDYVLDNLRSEVLDWRKAGYRWVMRQSQQNPQFWVSLNGGRPAIEVSADETLTASASEADAPAYEPAHGQTSAPTASGVSATAAPSVSSVRSGRGMSISALEESPSAGLLTAAVPLTLGSLANSRALYVLPPSDETVSTEGEIVGVFNVSEAGAWSLRGAYDEIPEA